MTPDADRRLAACLAGHPARVLVVVAHPDDEGLGCGGLLSRLADVHLVHITDGAPRAGDDARRHGFASPAAYAAARQAEARAALQLVGVPAERLSSFGLPDQEASLHLAAVVRRLVPMLATADLVLTHAFEGGHPDHDAVAFAVQAAVRLAAADIAVVEMPFYHAAPEGWHRQRFLPQGEAGPERVLPLDAPTQGMKARMLAAYATQGETLRSFDGRTERFRVAPAYRFAVRPHDGNLLYERHGWNLDWARWTACIAAAEAELGWGATA